MRTKIGDLVYVCYTTSTKCAKVSRILKRIVNIRIDGRIDVKPLAGFPGFGETVSSWIRAEDLGAKTI